MKLKRRVADELVPEPGAALAFAAATWELKVALRSNAIVAMLASAPTTTTAAATARILRARRRFVRGAGSCPTFIVLPPFPWRGWIRRP